MEVRTCENADGVVTKKLSISIVSAVRKKPTFNEEWLKRETEAQKVLEYPD